MKQNYQKMLEETIAKNQREERVPSLLLHSCCAPCSSYCLEYLSQYFKITVFYYNPNIYPEEEYTKRVAEQQHFIERLPAKYPISFVEGTYDKECFYEMARGLEDVKEGGERCFRCYELRLRESAELAKERGIDTGSVLIITSDFHMPRAKYIAGKLGMTPYGLTSDTWPWILKVNYQLREVFAFVKAWWKAR